MTDNFPQSLVWDNQCTGNGKCDLSWEKTDSFVLYLTYEPLRLFYFFANVLPPADPAPLWEVLLRITFK